MEENRPDMQNTQRHRSHHPHSKHNPYAKHGPHNSMPGPHSAKPGPHSAKPGPHSARPDPFAMQNPYGTKKKSKSKKPSLPPNYKPRQKNISGAERYNQYIEREKYKEYVQHKKEKRESEENHSSDESLNQAKGSLSPQSFENELNDDENLYLIAEKNEKKISRSTIIIRKSVITVLCLLISLFLNLLPITFPLTPSIVSIDFSSFPELLVCISVHPIASVALILIKNGLYYLINPSAAASIPNKILLDLIFIFSTWLFLKLFGGLKRSRNKEELKEGEALPKKQSSAFSVLISGLISGVLTALISAVTFQTILLPLLYKLLGDKEQLSATILKSYQAAFAGLTEFLPFIKRIVPALDSLKMGILIYNIPLNTFKYFCCAVFTAVAYYFISNLFSENKKAEEKSKE